MDALLLVVYSLSLLYIFPYSIIQVELIWLYLRNRKRLDRHKWQNLSPEKLPMVTVQLPVYNEKYVIGRLIEAVTRFKWAKEKLEIQVLDDSTDETYELISGQVAQLQAEGFLIRHLHRTNREGYKAGALKNGTEQAQGQFIAIFDADFLPHPDFLLETIPYFVENQEVGMVQARWSHLNENYSLLTRLQAFGLNAHFRVEQTGRFLGNYFINFNGTGGVWRKACIDDAGGWNADTLTEDLDLSYRAQINGWKLQFVEEYDTPAEIPAEMNALKNQQFRWSKGAAETTRKTLSILLKAKVPLSVKIHAIFVLINRTNFIFLLTTSVLSVPLLFVSHSLLQYLLLINFIAFLLMGMFVQGSFYWLANRENYTKRPLGWLSFARDFFIFLTVSMGMALHNSMAVVEGYLGVKTPFVRTPKFNILNKQDTWNNNTYVRPKISLVTVLEGVMFFYFLGAIGYAFFTKDYRMVLFHLMLALGYGIVFFLSLRHTVLFRRT